MTQTELSFLIEVLMNHKLPKPTKELVRTRIMYVESMMGLIPPRPPMPRPEFQGQAPSMQAIMARNPDLVAAPVAIVAQTPATAAALNSRQEAIGISLSGIPEKGRKSPRKF